jgi:glycyl-tRNA synthetase
MRSFCNFARTASHPKTFSPRYTARSFRATTQINKYQTPKFQNQKEPLNMTTTLKGQPFDRQVLDSMLRRRMFYTPSFDIYGGVAGLYDYGPVSCIFLSLSFSSPPFPPPLSPHRNPVGLASGYLDATAI